MEKESLRGRGPIRAGGDKQLKVSKLFPKGLDLGSGHKLVTYTNLKGFNEEYHIDPSWSEDCSFFRTKPGDNLNLNSLLKGTYSDVTITNFMKLFFKAEIVVPSVELIFELHKLLHEVGWKRTGLTARIGDDEEVEWDALVIPYIIANLKQEIILDVYRFAQETDSKSLKDASIHYLLHVNKFRVLIESQSLNTILPNEAHFEELYKKLLTAEVFPKMVPFSDLVSIISNYFNSINDATRYLRQIDYDQVDPKDSSFLNAFDHADLNGIKIKLQTKRIEQLEEGIAYLMNKDKAGK